MRKPSLGSSPVPRVLVVQHQPNAPAGVLGDWLHARGTAVDTVMAPEGLEGVGATGHQAIVSLGSEAHAYDDAVPWLPAELELLRDAIARGVPVLGICFGGQLLARAIGASVSPAARGEVGWYEPACAAPEVVPGGCWFRWHFDRFELPPGAELLASTESAPQAFRHGPSVGLQFHPEVTPAILAGWVESGRDEIERLAVDEAALVRETRRREREARRRAWRLFDAALAPALGPAR